jgi:ABC-type nitrate/sulfonate/bicarbonate transport system ATPase subunit
MNEPFGALDAITLTGEEKTILFVTRNVAEVIFFADRIFVFGVKPARIVEGINVDQLLVQLMILSARHPLLAARRRRLSHCGGLRGALCER